MKVSILYLVRLFLALCLLGLCLHAQEGDKANKEDRISHILSSGENPHVLLETTLGNMELELFTKAAPKAVENFLRLVDKGYYDGVSFHRVIKGFMIQSGDPSGTGSGGDSIWGDSFEDEIALGYAFDRGGLLAMANAGANTNRSQFFITVSRAAWLNGRHTIFGELKAGFDTLSALQEVKTDDKDRPLQTQRIIKARILP